MDSGALLSRRAVTGLAALMLAATLVPVAAGAKTRSYAGAFDAAPGASVTFNVVKNKHGKKKAKGFTFLHLPIACDDGPHTISAGFQSGSKLKKGSFNSITTFPTGGTASLLGRLSGASSASGNIEVTGTIPIATGGGTASATGCETGIQSWTASVSAAR